MLKTVSAALAALLLLAATAVAQDYRFDASVGATYAFSKKSSDSDTSQTPTHALGSLVSVRLHLSQKHSLELDWGHTVNNQDYIVQPLFYRVQTTINEVSGAYVFSPLKIGKIEPFLMAGAGAIAFNPGFTYVDSNIAGIGALGQTRAGFLYGLGVDYPVYWRVAVRVQYRGLIYRAPDFDVKPLFTGATGHMAEPSVGVVFRF